MSVEYIYAYIHMYVHNTYVDIVYKYSLHIKKTTHAIRLKLFLNI